MARPTKQGIDYFPLDVQFDDKVELYVAETGAVGLAVVVTIWQLIYQNHGYYIQNNQDLTLLVRRRLMADISEINTCISASISRGVFDSGMSDKHGILTSRAIQKRYFDAAKKKKSINVVENYIMSGVSVGENAVYSVGNATNVDVKVNVKEEVNVEVEEKGKEKEEESLPSKLDDAKRIIEYLNTKAGKGFKAVDSNLKLIRARMKEGHSSADIIAVIDRKCLQWPLGDKMHEYLRPSTLFGAEKFNQYVGELGVETPEQKREREMEEWINDNDNVIEGEVMQ